MADPAGPIIVYALAAAAAAVAQNTLPADPNIFWPCLLGAGFAGLNTVYPAFSAKSDEPPSAVMVRLLISLTGGFGVAYYGSEWLFQVFAKGVRPPLEFSALIVAAAGEWTLAHMTKRFQKSLSGYKGD